MTKTLTKKISERVRGKTIRFSCTEGPTKGATHEHIFHEDGTVEWHAIGAAGKAKSSSGDAAKSGDIETPKYAELPLSQDACMVSYLSKSGYTLTVTLQFDDTSIVGIASNDKTWFPVRGTFHVMP